MGHICAAAIPAAGVVDVGITVCTFGIGKVRSVVGGPFFDNSLALVCVLVLVWDQRVKKLGLAPNKTNP